MLSVPVGTDMKGGCSGIRYLHVPVIYCLWTKEKTKLEMAADAIDAVMKELKGKHVFVLCDSWYPKKKLITSMTQFNCPHASRTLVPCSSDFV